MQVECCFFSFPLAVLGSWEVYGIFLLEVFHFSGTSGSLLLNMCVQSSLCTCYLMVLQHVLVSRNTAKVRLENDALHPFSVSLHSSLLYSGAGYDRINFVRMN